MNLYKIDMHVHTSEVSPCGKVKAAEAVKLYKEAGYDGIVTTDHYFAGYFESLKNMSWEEKIDRYLTGNKIATAEGKVLGLDVIMAMEIRFKSSSNDYLVYGIDEKFLKENENLYEMSLEEFSILAKEKGLLIYQAHPFRINMTRAEAKYLYGIETDNANPRHDSHNDLAYEHAVKNNLKMISGSDFHQVVDVARGGIIAKKRARNSQELLSILKSNDYIIDR